MIRNSDVFVEIGDVFSEIRAACALLCAVAGGAVYEREENLIRATHAALIAERMIMPLTAAAWETEVWMNCELAARVENRFVDALIDPRGLGDEAREEWRRRATPEERIEDPHEESWQRRAYWLIDQGERAGTIALSATSTGVGRMSISSVYIFPEHRRRGLVRRVLERAYELLREYGGRCVRVAVPWAWQPAVRFCLNRGMWAAGWKHELVFGWSKSLPRWAIEEHAPDRATFVAWIDDRFVPLIEAKHEGARLGWELLTAFDAQDWDVRHASPGTFAVALAVRGWPLIRSTGAWSMRRYWSDFGGPEGLARKIEIFEARDRRHGFDLRTPRIPGIAYRSLEAID